jgi:hypothetical protein
VDRLRRQPFPVPLAGVSTLTELSRISRAAALLLDAAPTPVPCRVTVLTSRHNGDLLRQLVLLRRSSPINCAV